MRGFVSRPKSEDKLLKELGLSDRVSSEDGSWAGAKVVSLFWQGKIQESEYQKAITKVVENYMDTFPYTLYKSLKREIISIMNAVYKPKER